MTSWYTDCNQILLSVDLLVMCLRRKAASPRNVNNAHQLPGSASRLTPLELDANLQADPSASYHMETKVRTNLACTVGACLYPWMSSLFWRFLSWCTETSCRARRLPGSLGRVSSRLNRIAVIYLPHGLMIVEGCHGLLFLDKSSAWRP